MKKKVAEMLNYKVYKEDVAVNPYRIVKETYGADGRKHRTTFERFANLRSCLYQLAEIVDRRLD